MSEQVFEVTIPEKLYYSIGEVKEITGLEPHVLRYWESEFPTLRPKKNGRGQRTYQKKDIEMVLRIKDLLYKRKFTIAGAKKALKSDAGVDPHIQKEAEEMTIFLKRVHNELTSLGRSLKGEESDDLFGRQ